MRSEICLIQVLDGEEGQNQAKIMFEEIMAENFPELFRDRFKSSYESKQCKQREIYSQIHHTEFQNTKDGEKILKAVRGKLTSKGGYSDN